MSGNGAFHAVRDELHALLHFADFFRDAGLAQLYACTGFVNQIDSLVWKKAVGNVPVREIYGIPQSLVCVADGVKFLVALADSADDLNGFLFVGSRNFYSLEAAFE